MTTQIGSRPAVMAPARPARREPHAPTGRREFRCACGYGIILDRPLPACPMCQSEVWEQVGWQPFARSYRANPEQTEEKQRPPGSLRIPPG